MPVIQSAKKRMRANEKKRLQNKPIQTLCKTNITKAENLIYSGELEAAQQAVNIAFSSLDKAAEKGVLHANNTARRKSRLMKKLNEALTSVQGQVPDTTQDPDTASDTSKK